MDVIFAGKNHVEITPALREYVNERLRKVEKHFDHLRSAEVFQSRQRNWQIIEVTLHADGLIIRAKQRAKDVYASIDAVIDKLDRQITHYKERLIDRSRTAGNKRRTAETALAPEREVQPARIVKTKRFAVKPMTPEEAAMQMDLLGHNFFVFTNAETEQLNVLYRREDENYGLIEPAF